MRIKNQNISGETQVFTDKKIKTAIDRISRMKDDSGRAGCTYGDTDYDSLSAVYGYNQAIDHVVSTLNEILASK